MTPPRELRAPWVACVGLFVPFLLASAAPAQGAAQNVDLKALQMRPLGPAAMGGRIIDLAVDENRPSTFYAATASAGIWKTVNNGTTFQPLFQNEKVASLGAIAIASTDSKQVWAGTGESNNRNSSSWGSGVWFSKDGGKTWAFKGLAKTLHIARIAVHPKNPDIVYVAALGGLWGPNPERGLYRTKDRGETWELVLKKDARTGATEVRIDPQNPDIVYCALYERQRDGFDGNHPIKRFGAGSGMYKSSDGGTTWKQMTKGLPTVHLGRIQMDIHRADPRIIVALIESVDGGKRPQGAPAPEKGPAGSAVMGIGNEGEDTNAGAKLTQVTSNGAADAAGVKKNDVVIEIAGEPVIGYEELLDVLEDQRANDTVKVKLLRDGKFVKLDLTFGDNRRSGRGRRGGGSRTHPYADRIGGQRANARQGPNGFQTGGVFMTKDRGESWERINSLNPRPYYFSQIRIDPIDPKHIHVPGIQYWISKDGGKSFQQSPNRGVHVDHHALWINPKDGEHLILGCDGGINITYDRCKNWEVLENLDIGQCYHAVADNRRPYWVYAGYQDNGSWGSPSRTPYSDGVMNIDAFKIGGGDGFVCRVDPNDSNVVFSESQGGNIGWLNVMTGARGRVQRGGNVAATMQGGRTRSSRPAFNWDTPFLLSHWNSKTIYFAGDRVFRSVNRGRNTSIISPKLTSEVKGTPSAKPSATALAESKRQLGVLWVGTDDGNVWLTRDDGKNWANLSKNVQELLPNQRPLWVSHIHPSQHSTGRAFMTVDGHRSHDRDPYVFVTHNYGAKWESLAEGLPQGAGSAHAIFEDPVNADLLWLGTEMGLWVSLDRGKKWQRMPKPFPTVACRDFDLQQREQHMIVATHGRSAWMVDARPLRALTKANRGKKAYLVKPNDVLRLRKRSRSKQGHRHFSIPNPPEQATFYYWLKGKPEAGATVVVRDLLGTEMFSAKAATTPGLHRVDWNLRKRRGARSGARSRTPARGRAGRGGRGRGGAAAAAGSYSVTLEVGDTKLVQTFKIEDDKSVLDVSWPRPAVVGEGQPGNAANDEAVIEQQRRIR